MRRLGRGLAATLALAVSSRGLSAGHASPRRTAALYRIEALAPGSIRRFTPPQRAILEKLNRRDLEHLVRLEQIIVPEVWLDDELGFSPLPATWPWAEALPKAVVVHQPSQVFGAYESGRLVRWGPVSSGRQETPTPEGLFHLTWRSRMRRSTDNNEWLLKWYFNFVNERGVSFHQFELPGRPASHACVRLLERDAKWIFDWGEEWLLSDDKRTVVKEGTPVLILGIYDFDQPAPWLSLDWWSAPIALPDNPQRPD